MSTSPAVIIDVQSIAPRFRHPMIFGVFTTLPPGSSLLLVNDHDPKPLYYHFQAEYSGQFTWDYVENGPERWQVQIGRTGELTQADVDSRCCGGH